jgi:hypothetical protein
VRVETDERTTVKYNESSKQGESTNGTVLINIVAEKTMEMNDLI